MSQPLKVSLKPLKRVQEQTTVLDEASVRLHIEQQQQQQQQEERNAIIAEGSARWQPLLAAYSEVPARDVSRMMRRTIALIRDLNTRPSSAAVRPSSSAKRGVRHASALQVPVTTQFSNTIEDWEEQSQNRIIYNVRLRVVGASDAEVEQYPAHASAADLAACRWACDRCPRCPQARQGCSMHSVEPSDS
jgi:hypothetical protein